MNPVTVIYSDHLFIALYQEALLSNCKELRITISLASTVRKDKTLSYLFEVWSVSY
jgi:hypothetical protein